MPGAAIAGKEPVNGSTAGGKAPGGKAGTRSGGAVANGASGASGASGADLGVLSAAGKAAVKAGAGASGRGSAPASAGAAKTGAGAVAVAKGADKAGAANNSGRACTTWPGGGDGPMGSAGSSAKAGGRAGAWAAGNRSVDLLGAVGAQSPKVAAPGSLLVGAGAAASRTLPPKRVSVATPVGPPCGCGKGGTVAAGAVAELSRPAPCKRTFRLPKTP